jgi:CO/xanthine dehydrogenase Mo-binding subunit
MPHTRPANAVAAAIGARVFNLPIMPEKGRAGAAGEAEI